ncbi:MAG: hypothetical protein HN341_08380 [Verrucomicrobia bacterium]|jgi:hypothetical protein|nr:hypothetical protein [Verrucomicrobiota bacterium]
MKMVTRTIVEAAVGADPSIAPDQAAHALCVLDGSGRFVAPELLRLADVAVVTNVSRQTARHLLDGWIESGAVTPVVLKEGREYTSRSRHGSEFTRRSDMVRYRRSEILKALGVDAATSNEEAT